MATLKTLTINGTTYDVTHVVPANSVTLLSAAWSGDGDVYSQVVTIPGVTRQTKVDLQPTSEQLAEFHYLTVGFVAENDGGVVTVYAIGDRPTQDYTFQTTLTEVNGVGKIRGNTVGTTTPRANLEQDDPTMADYVFGRDAFKEGITPQRGEEVKMPITLGAFQYHTWGNIPGDTIEEQAQALARYDVIVYQGALTDQLSMSGSDYQRDLNLYTKAMEYNPNLKVFGYITARGFANSNSGGHVGMTEYRVSPQNVDHPIWTKEELAAYINLMAHCGGTKDPSATDEFGNPVLNGGVSLYGVFFDDYDYNFEDDNTHLINQGDWTSVREKHNFLIDYVHSCGMKAMPNSAPTLVFDNRRTIGNIAFRNPNGEPSHMTEDDWFCLESYFLRSDNTFSLNDEHLTTYNEQYRDAYKSKCLVLTYAGAVSDDAEDNEEIASTFAIYQALCQGADSIALHGATLFTEIPDELAKYYDKNGNAVRTYGDGYCGLTVNGYNIVASRSVKDTAYGKEPNSQNLSTCRVIVNGQRVFNNMYVSTEALAYDMTSFKEEVHEKVEEIKEGIAQNSNLYHRVLIDDWEKEYTVDDYKNHSFTFQNAFGGEDTGASSTWNSANPYDATIYLPKNGSWRRVLLDVRHLAGKTVELGFETCSAYLSGSTSTKLSNVVWQVQADCDSASAVAITTFNANTVRTSKVDGVDRCCVEFTLPDDANELIFWTHRLYDSPSGTWVVKFTGSYLVDLSEHAAQKTWFTNYAPPMSDWGAMGNWSNYQIIRNDDQVVTNYTSTSGCYESGVTFPANPNIFKPGETWEIGFKDLKLVQGTATDMSSKLVIMMNIGTSICPNVYMYGNSYADFKAMKSATGDDSLIAVHRFTIPESYSGGMPEFPMYIWPENYIGGDANGLYYLLAEGLYLYNIDEKDELVIRGEEPSDTYVGINRVRTDTIDKVLTPDTLYIVDDGTMFITDYRGNRVDLSGVAGGTGADGVSPTVDVSKTGKVTTISITDKNGTKTATINDGADGASGSNGKDGSDGVSATHSWNGTTLTITSASGTSSANLKGEKGDDGKTPVKGVDYFDGNNGKDGTSVTVKSVSESTADGGSNVVTFSDGKTVTIKNGSTGPQGPKGDTGPAYSLTTTDKNTIALVVKASLKTESWTFTLEDGSTVTKAVYVG